MRNLTVVHSSATREALRKYAVAFQLGVTALVGGCDRDAPTAKASERESAPLPTPVVSIPVVPAPATEDVSAADLANLYDASINLKDRTYKLSEKSNQLVRDLTAFIDGPLAEKGGKQLKFLHAIAGPIETHPTVQPALKNFGLDLAQRAKTCAEPCETAAKDFSIRFKNLLPRVVDFSIRTGKVASTNGTSRADFQMLVRERVVLEAEYQELSAFVSSVEPKFAQAKKEMFAAVKTLFEEVDEKIVAAKQQK